MNHPIVPGALLVFGEYHVPVLEADELKAFVESTEEHDMEYRYLATVQSGNVRVVIA